MAPLTIGLTGGIGAGKSTVASLFQKLGAEIVSGDELGKIAVETNPVILTAILNKFGSAVFQTDMKLNRRELGRRVFSDRAASQWLRELTFPEIFRQWNERICLSKSAIILFDAALIFEWNIENSFDLLVVVKASTETVTARGELSGRFTADEIRERLSQQLSPDFKAARADLVIQNDSEQIALISHVQRVWTEEITPKLNRKLFLPTP